MLTLDSLRAFGANVDEGLNRCMNNEAFYLRLVGMAVQSTDLDDLQAALQREDYKAAFESAHKLKGVLANLSLTPVCEPVSRLTDLLRAQTPVDCQADLDESLARMAELKALAT